MIMVYTIFGVVTTALLYSLMLYHSYWLLGLSLLTILITIVYTYNTAINNYIRANPIDYISRQLPNHPEIIAELKRNNVNEKDINSLTTSAKIKTFQEHMRVIKIVNDLINCISWGRPYRKEEMDKALKFEEDYCQEQIKDIMFKEFMSKEGL